MGGVSGRVRYGKAEISYELLRTNRKSMEIAVHPDKRVVVKAPVSSSIEAIEDRVRKRAPWITRQITYFDQFDPRTPERRYVGGESHLYLGRKYRLKIQPPEDGRTDRVVLKNGYFFIDSATREPSHVKALLDAWYREHAEAYLSKVFDECWRGFSKQGLRKPTLRLKKMNTRWGSLSAKGQLSLNLDLIRAPGECAEYVVVHELCHLVHHNHGPEFYRLLDRTMPDWMKRKHKLELALA